MTQRPLPGVVGWPHDCARRYRDRGYWAGETLGRLVDWWAELHGDRIAIVDGNQRVTYTELAQRSLRLAGQLRLLGIGREDRIVVQLPNGLPFCDLTLALFRIGAIPIMALPAHREHEVGYLIQHARAVALAIPERQGDFEHLAMARRLQSEHPSIHHLLVSGDSGKVPGEVSLEALTDAEPAPPLGADGPAPEDVALFLLSGGTTGLPKLIPRTHDDYAYNARAAAEVCGFGPHTVYLATLPASHNFPLACPGLLGTWEAGGCVVLGKSPDVVSSFELIERERVTVTALVPTVAIRWVDAPEREQFDLSSLEVVQVGGARLAPEAAKRIEPTLGAKLQQVFGMAEGLLNYTRLDDPDEVILETQGRPMSPDDEIRIVNAAGDPVVAGEPGELLARGPYTIRGYYLADEHNARAFTPDGFYRTGDIVRQHSSGNLIVEGRAKDLINRGGEKISAEEIENLVLAHPNVLNVAAVAMPDDDLGERTCVYVVLRDSTTLELHELCAFLMDQRIAKYKLPERMEVVTDLPVTNVGKIDKRRLREDVRAKLVAERTPEWLT